MDTEPINIRILGGSENNMIDSADLVILVRPSEINLDESLGWWQNDLTYPGSFYPFFHKVKDRQTGIYLKHYKDRGYNNPSRVILDISSLPRMVHPSNLFYFTESDIPQFVSRIEHLFRRYGISADVNADKLFIDNADFTLNIPFLSRKDVRDVLYGLQQPLMLATWEHYYPWIEEDGIYYRSGRKNKNLTWNTGFGIYDKNKDIVLFGYFNEIGILRFELRQPDSTCIIRRFGKRPSLREFFDSREILQSMYQHFLRICNIEPGTMMVSKDEAVNQLVRPYLFTSTWPDNLLRFTDLEQRGKNAFGAHLLMKNKRQAKRFINYYLKRQKHLMPAFLPEGTDQFYDLYSMVAEEFNSFWDGTSRFIAENAETVS